MMRTVYGNQQRFETTYFKTFPGYYVTGDGNVNTKICPELTGGVFIYRYSSKNYNIIKKFNVTHFKK